jgi:hypothetical protein
MRQPAVPPSQSADSISPFPLRVDLSSFSPTRGDEKQDTGNKVHLPQKLLRIKFLLPLGMEPGEYAMRLQDRTGTVFADLKALAHMTDGITSVDVNVDLARAPRGSFVLMIRPPGLSWRRFPVEVE